MQTGTNVLRIARNPPWGVEVDAFNHHSGNVERWQAPRCVVALPSLWRRAWCKTRPHFGASRPAPAMGALGRDQHPPERSAGRPPWRRPAWDNVIYGDSNPGGLGYVDASHQKLDPRPGPTVLTYYQALGDVADARQQLATQGAEHWGRAALASLAGPHPDVLQRATRVQVTRYGHAMSIPCRAFKHF